MGEESMSKETRQVCSRCGAIAEPTDTKCFHCRSTMFTMQTRDMHGQPWLDSPPGRPQEILERKP